jgi:hypothetical protein
VRFLAVQLDDQALLSPETVGFDLAVAEVQECVELGLGEVGVGEQGGESALESASPAAAWTASEASQAHLDGSRSSPARMAREKRLEIRDAEPMQVFRLADRSFEAFYGRFAGDVE